LPEDHNRGHFVAYVRESRIVSEQETSSRSSSWFGANDNSIREVSLDEVLKCEALLLFYEKVEASDMHHIMPK
jgi:ubiquitin carboxyl-terminal hydrolase 16/45